MKLKREDHEERTANGSKPYYDKVRKRWRIQYTDNEGKPQAVYDKTEEGVVAKFQEIKVALNKGKYIKKSKDTINYIMEKMLESQKSDMKPNSFSRKKDTAKVISEMSIASKPIQKVSKDQIKKEFEILKNQKKPNGKYRFSQSYLDKIFLLLREVFEQAVEDKKVSTEDNPFKTKKGAKKPKSNKKTKQVKPFTKAECILFLQELNKGYDYYTDVFWVLILTGMRVRRMFSIKN